MFERADMTMRPDVFRKRPVEVEAVRCPYGSLISYFKRPIDWQKDRRFEWLWDNWDVDEEEQR